MRINRFVTIAIGGVLFAGVSSSSAHAGCFSGNATSCAPTFQAHPAPMYQAAPIHTYGQTPYGYLKNFGYKNTPNVNIMRLHSRAPVVGLSDRPIQFSAGCNPNSTVYCRAPQGPRFISAPKVARPVSIELYPKPTPYVAPVMPAPRPVPRNVIGRVVTGQYSYQPQGGGQYWEKTSGPTIVDDLPATQILCRREAPRPAPVNVRVVSPVIGVPYPVPTPVPYPVYTPECRSANMPTLAGAPRHMGASRYGNRWTY